MLNAVVGLIVASFLSFFEEIGWRAWLLPRLRDRIGDRRAVVLTAIIWGFWHVPFQLSGIQHIDGVSPVRLALTLPVGIAVTGLIIGWLWLRTESIWVVTVAHGALNALGQYAFKYMKDSVVPGSDAATGAAGSVALLGRSLVALARCPISESRFRGPGGIGIAGRVSATLTSSISGTSADQIRPPNHLIPNAASATANKQGR